MAALTTMTMTASCHASSPAWLRAVLADVEERVQALAVNVPDDSVSDSFAQRAENYYRKRPQLVALLHDLHNRYLYLANRYCQSLRRQRCRASSVSSDIQADDDFDSAASDAESSLSFQPVPLQPRQSLAAPCDVDMVVAELVVASVERDLLAAEGVESKRRQAESSRKIELQGSLVEVLEAERMVLLGENVRLGLRAASLEEEARAVESELGFMRRRAAELAWALVQLRENQRVCLLGRKIEGLQAQVYGLERRNRELFLAIAQREKEKREARAEVECLRRENRRAREMVESVRGRSWRSWWDRVRKLDWAPSSCAPHLKQR
ncbi:kinase-interacting family protein-like [Curcuma longa]|uniref:kinase-interacting family protein-like n=1 Tax=Curcuma longa TaxID=136217 RepID=UPI003D9F8F3A